jgi:hypothetical protein
MADEKTVIRSLISPTITLDDLVLDDLYEGTAGEELGPQAGKKTGRQIHKDIGVQYPFININNYVFTREEIVKFELDATGFLPTVQLEVQLTNTNVFKSQAFPKDGDILSLFIRAKNDAFKPIRNDYIINRVDGGPGGKEGGGSTITFWAELFIPRMRDEIIKLYEGSTYEVTQQVCKDLGLGFATNETSTDDSQSWICAGDDLYNFMKHVINHAWKDEKSFYRGYVDVYYHFNFINVNNQVEGDGKVTAALIDTSQFKNFASDDDVEENSQVKSPKLLSDMDNYSGTNAFIRQYEVQNFSSDISKRWGYKSYAQFYDQKSQEYWEIFVDPIISEGAAESKIVLKGRPYPKKADGTTGSEDYWQTQIKKFWLGIQYKDVHDKYLYAKLWNARNNEELEKMYIEAICERWNPNIYCGEKIPVLLITQGDLLQRRKDSTPGAESQVAGDEALPVMNQLYSGFYMVSGLKIMYNMSAASTDHKNPPTEPASSLTETFRLARREWPVPSTG